jgi:glycine betaine/proline transport system ATP-binding protein
MSAAQRLERADAALHRVGLGDWGDAAPHELSGGMRQRVGLARALATDCDILLMDEPFSALDPLIRRELQDELVVLQQKLKKTIVFVTHDFQEAVRIGSRIAMLRQGRVVQVGTPSAIVARPADLYVAAFSQELDRSRLICAGDLLRSDAAHDAPADAPRVGQGEPLHGLYPLMARHSHVAVTGDDGAVLGHLSARDVFAGLQEPEAHVA